MDYEMIIQSSQKTRDRILKKELGIGSRVQDDKGKTRLLNRICLKRHALFIISI